MEVLHRHSNLPDVLKLMQDVLRRIEENDQADKPGVRSTSRGGGPVPVRERLGDAGLRELLASRRDGTLLRTLAERYGISLSSVNRVLREARTSAAA